MSRLTLTDDIAAPPEVVWRVLSDPQLYTEYVTFTDEVTSVSEGEFGNGTVYHEIGGIGPFKGSSQWTVTEFEPHTHQTHVGKQGPMTIYLDFRLEPQDGGTRVHWAMEDRFFLPLRPVAALLNLLFMRRLADEGMKETAANFKALAEAEAP